MIPDDLFNQHCRGLAEALAPWLRNYGAAIDASVEEGQGFLRLAGRPRAKSAVAIDLVIAATQRLDLDVGGETYEDLPATDVPSLAALFEAAAQGVIVTRRWQLGNTGAHVATDTVFDAYPLAQNAITANGWILRQTVQGARATDLVGAVALDRRYTPWVR